MSTFDNMRREKEKREQRINIRKEKIASYFFDLSKLVFAGMVVGVALPIITERDTAGEMWIATVIGISLTIILGLVANKFLKV